MLWVTLIEFLLRQVIDSPTRIHNKCISLIDLIFTNLNNISEKGTIDVGISDHLPVFLVIKKCRRPKKPITTKGRIFKNYRKEFFQKEVRSDPQRESFWNQKDVNKKWMLFYEIVNCAADKSCPLIDMKFNTENEGWLTKEVLEAIFEKIDCLKLLNHSSLENWAFFKAQRKYARTLLLNTKEEFLKNQIAENRNNPRAFWWNLNNILGNTKNRQCFNSVIDDSGKKLERKDAAEFMNKYFTTIGETLNIDYNTVWAPHHFFPIVKPNSFFLNVVDENIVLKYVKMLDISKPSGIDNVNNRLLCDAFKVVINELTSLFNESITQNVFPDEWKTGLITPISKPGNLLLKTNWRPITILNTLGKLLEKIIHFQTTTF